MAEKNRVVFRKVRGRIIPIKIKDPTAGALKESAAYTGAGAATILATALGVGESVKRAKRFRQYSRFADIDSKTFPESSNFFQKNKASFMKSSKMRMKTGKALKFGAFALGGGLLGKGIEKGVEAYTGKEASGAQQVASSVAGQGTAALFYLGTGIGMLSGKTRAASRIFRKAVSRGR